MKIEFHDSNISKHLKYVVIVAQDTEGFVLVKHQTRNTWELPGGHIEPNETTFAAAKRELTEETTASEFTLKEICVYSVSNNNQINYGGLFYAQIHKYEGSLQHEINETNHFPTLPKALTYPAIQPFLFHEVINRLQL